MPPDSLDGASSYSKIMIPNVLLKQHTIVFQSKKLNWPCHSPNLNLTEHAFHMLKRKLKASIPQNQQELKIAAL
uniref:Tc1-like transposase DDE domain-containing protein n=1 Tax=Anguilla anguilla TaxID=7936 RepID=A0A0E9WF94_ANGAN